MTDAAAIRKQLAVVEPVEFRCGCGRLIFKARTLGAVEVETKCPRCNTVTQAVLPAAEIAAA